MKRVVGIAVSLVVLLSPAVRSADGGEESTKNDDAKLIQGTWLPTSAEFAGEKWPDQLVKSLKLVIKDDKYTVTVGEAVDKGTSKVDSTAKPKRLEIKGTDGPNKGKTFLAIYELTKDRLKICYDLSGKAYPTEFKTEPNTKLYLVVYEREKP